MIFHRFKPRFIKQSKPLIRCYQITLTIQLGINPSQLVTDLFTCSDLWSTSYWFFSTFQEWTDANMRWNKTEYSDIEDIRIPPARLWKPDILMYNRSGVKSVEWCPSRPDIDLWLHYTLLQTTHMANMSQLASLVIGWWLLCYICYMTLHQRLNNVCLAAISRCL